MNSVQLLNLLVAVSLIASASSQCENYIGDEIDCDPDVGNNECQVACQQRTDPALNKVTGTCLNVGDATCNPGTKLKCLCSGQSPVAGCSNYVKTIDCATAPAGTGNKECQTECQIQGFVTGSCLVTSSLSDAGACSISTSKVCVCYCNPFAP